MDPRKTRNLGIAIEGGKIVAIGHDDLMPSAREELRADGQYLLPGAIDSHVHFRDPGYPHKETWKTGSAAGCSARAAANSNSPRGPVSTCSRVATNTTRVAIKRGAWLRGYAYRFIESFVPTLTRDVVEQAVVQGGRGVEEGDG